jgi:hypothetical protein
LISCRGSEKFNLTPNDELSEKGCNINEKLAFVVHGWRENINSDWVPEMIEHLTEARGGCVIVVDYSFYGNNPRYFAFLQDFPSISRVITKKLKQLEADGFNPDDWFMFGQSFGSRLVIDSAANFGYQKVKEIDGKFLIVKFEFE